MISSLKLSNVGPAPALLLEFGERLNLLTGDNGLGKSFLLDIIWWSLTRKWPAEVNPALPAGLMAKPFSSGPAGIEFEFVGQSKKVSYASSFERKAQAWTGRSGRPTNPGLVLYAQVDGSFAVWDPARNYWRQKGNMDVQDRPPAYVFNASQVWHGLRDELRGLLCNGLIVDWAGWQKEGGQPFARLTAALKTLSPSKSELIFPGKLTRIHLDDPRDIPTLVTPYSDAVAVLHASAGIRRIISLAYLLVWTWEEHLKASELLDQRPTSQVTFLIDEIEAHLHPKWQRRIVSTLLEVVKTLTQKADVQLIAATHSPLVLASVETTFDSKTDAWFDLDLEADEKGPCVRLTKRPFVRQGDVSNSLISQAFDMESARSIEAEVVLRDAALALSAESMDPARARELDARLRAVLSDTDPFWVRWCFVADKKGWLRDSS